MMTLIYFCKTKTECKIQKRTKTIKFDKKTHINIHPVSLKSLIANIKRANHYSSEKILSFL